MIGDVHAYLDGRTYVETLHGPNNEGVCRGCGGRAHATPDVIARNEAMCSGCLIVANGAKPGVERIVGARRGDGRRERSRRGPGLAEARAGDYRGSLVIDGGVSAVTPGVVVLIAAVEPTDEQMLRVGGTRGGSSARWFLQVAFLGGWLTQTRYAMAWDVKRHEVVESITVRVQRGDVRGYGAWHDGSWSGGMLISPNAVRQYGLRAMVKVIEASETIEGSA